MVSKKHRSRNSRSIVLTRRGKKRIQMKKQAEITREVVEDAKQGDCCICLEKANIPLRLPCKHCFCFLCIKSVCNFGKEKEHQCPLCRGVFDDEYITAANMSRGIYELNQKESDVEVQWKYSGRSGGWWLYDDAANTEIDTHYRAYIKDLRCLVDASSCSAEIAARPPPEDPSSSNSSQKASTVSHHASSSGRGPGNCGAPSSGGASGVDLNDAMTDEVISDGDRQKANARGSSQERIDEPESVTVGTFDGDDEDSDYGEDVRTDEDDINLEDFSSDDEDVLNPDDEKIDTAGDAYFAQSSSSSASSSSACHGMLQRSSASSSSKSISSSSASSKRQRSSKMDPNTSGNANENHESSGSSRVLSKSHANGAATLEAAPKLPEGAAQPKSKECHIEIGPREYVLDFETMVQYDVHNRTRSRRIQRTAKVQVARARNTKGQAGVSFKRYR